MLFAMCGFHDWCVAKQTDCESIKRFSAFDGVGESGVPLFASRLRKAAGGD